MPLFVPATIRVKVEIPALDGIVPAFNRFVDYLESQVSDEQPGVDELTAKLEEANRKSQQANTTLETVVEENKSAS